MARRPNASQRRQLDALLARLEPELRAAFMAAIDDLLDGADWGALIEALGRRDVEAALAALNIEPAAFARYAQVSEMIFFEGGAAAATLITAPGVGRVMIRFDMRNPAAETWIRQNVGERITAITRDTMQAARDAIRTGFEAGRHPQSIALDLVGRRGAQGVREGGILGLDGPRAERMLAVTHGMETAEGVADLVQGGKVRYKVNRATELRILKAYRNGEAVPAADRAISVRQYGNQLLRERGETIGRTETLQAVMGARQEAWRQGLEKLDATPQDVVKTWWHGGGPKDPREHHVAMSGQIVRGLETPFEFSNGARLRYAGDPDGGAAEVINCTCNTTYALVRQGNA